MSDFLDELDLSEEEREHLRALGAPDARALRAMHRAAPDDFAAYVGSRTEHILTELDRVAPEGENTAQSPTLFGLGGRNEAPPDKVVSPSIDIELRDRLFQELEDWRNRPPSPQRDAAIADLEDQLNAMLDSNA